MRNLLAALLVILLAGLSCGTCSLCGGESSDENLIRGLIDRATELAEKQDISGLLDLATEDFRVLPRKLDRKDTRRYLFLAFRRYRDFSLLFPRPAVDLDPGGELATAGIVYLLVRRGETAPDLGSLREDPAAWTRKVTGMANLFRIRLNLIKLDGAWRVQQAHFERFKGTGFGP